MKKNRYLVIAMNFERLAAGLVFKRIIESLGVHASCDIITSDVNGGGKLININRLYLYKQKCLPTRIDTILNRKLGYHVADNIWGKKVGCLFSSSTEYDAILSFVYGGNYSPLVSGMLLKKRLGKPWIIYSVDAIPKPIEWTNDTGQWQKVFKYLNKFIPNCDGFFSANPNMLNYEQITFKEYRGTTGIILTPYERKQQITVSEPEHSGIIFLYAGYLYGPRKVDTLLEAFARYNSIHSNTKLVFVGSAGMSLGKYSYLCENGVVEIHGYTKKIDWYYEQADVLIDLNADIENDVFLSSKVCNYLSFDNKPILAISQNGSPVRRMMSGVESIIHAHHDATEIFEAMQKCARQVGKMINDRQELKVMFAPETVGAKLADDIVSVILQFKDN